MNLDKFLYNNSVYYFAIFFLIALWAFWPGYYGRLSGDIPYYIHLHGIAMTIWCLTLIGQAVLIRLKRNRIHKAMGKISYVLVPVILITGFHTAHYVLKDFQVHSAFYYSNIALMFNALIIFAIIYGLAIYHRKQPVIHGRYMLCTIFPILTPITDRLVYYHAESILRFMPTMDGIAIVWIVGFALADLLLIALVIWDWRVHRKLNVFPVALGLVLLYQISVLAFHQFAFWRSFGDWLMGLPLS